MKIFANLLSINTALHLKNSHNVILSPSKKIRNYMNCQNESACLYYVLCSALQLEYVRARTIVKHSIAGTVKTSFHARLLMLSCSIS